jgi:uncharacterized membrane protein
MGKLRMALTALAVILTVFYPLVVYFGLQMVEPRVLAVLLLAIVLLRHSQAARRVAAELKWPEWLTFAALCGLALAIMTTNRAELLLLYPVAVNLSMLVIFGRTLLRPPSIIERFARLAEPDLSPKAVQYTRKVTIAWCVFFSVNACIALSTVFMSREHWVIYNGLISYLLMGLLFLGEWIVRARFRRCHA